MTDVTKVVESLVLTVHRRNGGTLTRLGLRLKLLDPKLALDSLDLAEIMVGIERHFGCSPFDGPKPPRTWADVVAYLANRCHDDR